MILITGFEPFDGRTVNGSETIASFLNDRPAGDDIMKTQILPVVWQDIERFCETTIHESDATMILGFGEADCPRPRLERLARPDCIGIDNNGRDAPRPSSAQLPLQCTRIVCESHWFDDLVDRVDVSTDAGAYLCNWFLLNALKHARVPAGFIHVPVQNDMTQDDYVATHVPAIERLIAMNAQRIRRGPIPDSTQHVVDTLPT